MASGHRGDAEDAVQEAYIIALRRWAEVGGYDAPEAWVPKVAMRRLWRSQRRHRHAEQLAVTVPPNATPEETAYAREVLGALATLPPPVRIAMVMCAVLGWSQAEVAEVLQVPRNTIANRIFRGRAKLAAQLGMTAPVTGVRDPLVPTQGPVARFAVLPGRPGWRVARPGRELAAGRDRGRARRGRPESGRRSWNRPRAPEEAPGQPEPRRPPSGAWRPGGTRRPPMVNLWRQFLAAVLLVGLYAVGAAVVIFNLVIVSLPVVLYLALRHQLPVGEYSGALVAAASALIFGTVLTLSLSALANGFRAVRRWASRGGRSAFRTRGPSRCGTSSPRSRPSWRPAFRTSSGSPPRPTRP